ncbi:hypothetical protein GF373_09365, partial [bacterium]|nr:hypothetical protein [bacterium]
GPLGHVYPCCHPDAHRLLGMGNLKNKRFKRIWYGRSYQTLREGMKGVIPYPCSNCSMSGRSDGDVPLTKETENKDFLTEANPFIPYPKQFIPRRLRFLDFVYNQNIAVKRHLDNLQAIEKQAKAYQEKLLTA